MKTKIKNMPISKKILTVNIPILIIFMILFIGVSLIMKEKIDNGIENANKQSIDILSTDIEDEKKRLSNLLILCADDPAFILAMASKTDYHFVNYAEQASKQLTVIKNALPYAQEVYAYSSGQQKFILSNNAVTGKNAYLKQFEKQLADYEIIPDFENLENGFTSFANFTLYVKNVQNYGSIIVQFNPNDFFDKNKINSGYMNYDYMVLNPEQAVFSTSLNKEKQEVALLKVKEINKRPKNKYIDINDEKFEVIYIKDILSGYMYFLFRDTNVFLNDYIAFIVTFAVGILVVLFLSSAIIIMNSKIYRPIREIAINISPFNTGDEIKTIENEISNLNNENKQFSHKLNTLLEIQREMATLYLLDSSDTSLLSPEIISGLNSISEQYIVIMLIAQDNNGYSDMEMLFKIQAFIKTELECSLLNQQEHEFLYIYRGLLNEKEISEQICCFLKQAYSGTDLVLIGISNTHKDVKCLKKAKEEALAAILSVEIKCSECSNFYVANFIKSKSHLQILNIDEQNNISNCLLSANPQELENSLLKIFDIDKKHALSWVNYLYITLKTLLEATIYTTGIKPEKLYCNAYQGDIIYNPCFALDIIKKDFIQINKIYRNEQGNLKYNIIDYIHSHYSEDISLSGLAEAFGLTSSYLSAWFKKSTGSNFSVYLSKIRIDEAKNILLSNNSITVADVGKKVGINNAMTFNRQFKNNVGTTPEQYRRINIGKYK